MSGGSRDSVHGNSLGSRRGHCPLAVPGLMMLFGSQRSMTEGLKDIVEGPNFTYISPQTCLPQVSLFTRLETF